MAKPNEFVEFLLEQLAPLGPVTARAMFGGHGIYLDGAMFGIVDGDGFYIKGDDLNRASLEDAGMDRFAYESKGRPMTMSYYAVPGDALDEPEVLLPWVESAIAAARRAKAKKKPRKKAR
ncbi:MAG: TfoX/Sxy family protein [Alphaproteobacteria bacterium]|nr:TfoX/Sxy family protein [Alphaproteobacteria bacterium]